MSHPIALEPNPAPGRLLTPRYFNDLTEYQEVLAACGRSHGLIPDMAGWSTGLPYLDPPDVLHLRSICAYGMRGRLLLANAEYSEAGIPAFDTSDLPVGTHAIYACLSGDKIPFGPLVRDGGSSRGDSDASSYREYRIARVALTAGDQRMNYQDWLGVAEIERCREGGIVVTKLNREFHPPVLSMRAYLHPNPLTLLANRGLALIQPEREERAAPAARDELALLQNLAEEASPEIALLQTQRCLLLLRQLGDPQLLFDARLEGWRFNPNSFTSFLSLLRSSLEKGGTSELYPSTLEIEGTSYQRLTGELREEDDFWTWAPGIAGFVANGLALYLPLSPPGSLPVIKYSLRRSDPHSFGIAGTAQSVSGSGAAVLFDRWGEQTGRIYLTADAQRMDQRLRKQLGDGHAFYYY
jgi:hypothetical protein